MGTFADRVMAQVSQEPKPTPARVFVRSLLALRPGAAVAALATAWHLAFGHTRAIPSVVRFQSLTLLLVLAVVVGTGGTLATAGALRVIDRPADPTAPPLPVIVVGPSPALNLSPTPSPSPTPDVKITLAPERRSEEVLPPPRKRNQTKEGGTESGDRKRSRDDDEQQKKQPARDSSGAKKQDQSQDGSGRTDAVVKQPAKTPKPAAGEGDGSGQDQGEKSGRGS